MSHRHHSVKQLTLAIVLASATVAAAEPAAISSLPSPEGHWEGAIVIQPAQFEVDLSLDLAPAADGSWTGKISFPTQFLAHHPLESAFVEQGTVGFISVENGVTTSYRGTLSPDGKTIEGEVAESGQKAPFYLHRVDRKAAPAALVTLGADGGALKERFNQDAGSVRLLMILAPACGKCRMGAILANRYVLQQIQDPRVKVYVVWEKVGAKDSADLAREASALVVDERVTHFWSPDHFAGKAFQQATGFGSSPAWDVFLLFPGDSHWGDTPPVAKHYLHNHEEIQTLPKSLLMNGNKLADLMKPMLVKAPAARQQAPGHSP